MGGGITYIYVCYGIHHLMNVVTGPPEMPHGVLIRGIEPVEGVDIMLARRQLPYLQHRLTTGPGSLTQALGISRVHNGFALTGNSPIWIEDRKIVIPSRCIMQSPRVGVGYAQEHQYRPWRFRIKNNSWTSPAK
jgi:DNA-3-methyladenine glycosylase